MGFRNPSVFSNTIANATIVTTAETVICVTPPLNIPFDNTPILLVFFCAISTGTGTTSAQVRLRRGTTVAGPPLNVLFGALAAGVANITQGGGYFDVPGLVAGQQYCMTFTQTGASANGTVFDVSMLAFAL